MRARERVQVRDRDRVSAKVGEGKWARELERASAKVRERESRHES